MSYKRIYIAADEKLGGALADPLERAGMSVTRFGRASDLLAALRRDPPDALLVGPKLEEGSGLAAWREISPELRPPAMALLSAGQQHLRADMFALGFADVAISPVRMRAVVGRLVELTGARPRAEVRRALRLPADLVVDGRPLAAETFDVSREGVGIATAELLQPGTLVSLVLHPGGGAPISVFAKVVHSRPQAGSARFLAGLRLLALTQAEETAFGALADSPPPPAREAPPRPPPVAESAAALRPTERAPAPDDMASAAPAAAPSSPPSVPPWIAQVEAAVHAASASGAVQAESAAAELEPSSPATLEGAAAGPATSEPVASAAQPSLQDETPAAQLEAPPEALSAFARASNAEDAQPSATGAAPQPEEAPPLAEGAPELPAFDASAADAQGQAPAPQAAESAEEPAPALPPFEAIAGEAHAAQAPAEPSLPAEAAPALPPFDAIPEETQPPAVSSMAAEAGSPLPLFDTAAAEPQAPAHAPVLEGAASQTFAEPPPAPFSAAAPPHSLPEDAPDAALPPTDAPAAGTEAVAADSPVAPAAEFMPEAADDAQPEEARREDVQPEEEHRSAAALPFGESPAEDPELAGPVWPREIPGRDEALAALQRAFAAAAGQLPADALEAAALGFLDEMTPLERRAFRASRPPADFEAPVAVDGASVAEKSDAAAR